MRRGKNNNALAYLDDEPRLPMIEDSLTLRPLLRELAVDLVARAVNILKDRPTSGAEATAAVNILHFPSAEAEALAFFRSDWARTLIHFIAECEGDGDCDEDKIIQGILERTGHAGRQDSILELTLALGGNDVDIEVCDT